MEYIIILMWVLGAWVTAHDLTDHGGDTLPLSDVGYVLLWPGTSGLIFAVFLAEAFTQWWRRV